jgi:CTP:molybdopterin cytidylyltransferase MocA
LRIERVRTVVLGGGRSRRMGFDKLAAPFGSEPLARRLARALQELAPLFVTTPEVASLFADLAGVTALVTPPTAGPSRTLQLAHDAVHPELSLAVLPADLPFIDAARVRAFVARVPDDADLAWPLVGSTPGHPVIWSPRARTRIAALGDLVPPLRVRDDDALRVLALPELDSAYVDDVDTPEGWAAAAARAGGEPPAAD